MGAPFARAYALRNLGRRTVRQNAPTQSIGARNWIHQILWKSKEANMHRSVDQLVVEYSKGKQN